VHRLDDEATRHDGSPLDDGLVLAQSRGRGGKSRAIEVGRRAQDEIAPFLKSNYGEALVRSPRMTGTIAQESMCQEK
jgi:hypothetical protein